MRTCLPCRVEMAMAMDVEPGREFVAELARAIRERAPLPSFPAGISLEHAEIEEEVESELEKNKGRV